MTRDQRGVLGLVAGGLVVLGLMEGSAGALWPDVIDAFDVSKGAFGVASGIGLSVAFPVLVFGGRITTRFDKRNLLGVAAAFLILACLGLTIGHALLALSLLLIVRGIGICLIDLACNALAMEVENQTGRHFMSPLHSGFSAGAVVGAGISWLIFELGGTFRTIYIVLAALLAIYVTLAFREGVTRPMRRERTSVAGASSLALELFKRPDIRLLTVTALVSFCGELLIAQWIGIYLRDELGYSTSIGVRAVILLGACMFVGRLVNQPLTGRLGPRNVLLLQGVVLTCGGVLLVATESATVTILGCGVAGLGVAGIAPTALYLAGLAVPSAPGAASGAMLLGGYFGVAMIPFVAGGIAEVASVRYVLLIEIVFGIVVFAAGLLLRRWVNLDQPGVAV
ncbi:MAG: MFS transporter [Thermomicrobiales bacterium]|nr:MFS transporter [Thermomicrobiales bacterium]